MSEERHTVVVHEKQVQEYLDRGYRLEEQSAADYMRGSPAVKAANVAEINALFADSRVMTIEATEKRKLDTPKQQYALRMLDTLIVASKVAVCKYDVLDETGARVLAAPSDRDGVDSFFKDELFPTVRDCVQAHRGELLNEAAKMRKAADAIDEFLKRHEAL